MSGYRKLTGPLPAGVPCNQRASDLGTGYFAGLHQMEGPSMRTRTDTHKRSRRLRVAVSTVIAALTVVWLPAIALAGTQGSCLSNDTSKFRLWENVLGDTGDDNDTYWKCANDSDLNNDAHSLPGDCKGAFFNSTTWNDCVSSVSVWVPAGWCANFYRTAGYDNLMSNNTVQGPASGVRINLQNNDELSSLLFFQC